MPRVDPTAPEMEFPNEQSLHIAQQFAAVHEEYLTDWSLGKTEKWSFQEVENGVARRARCSSPVHTDSESDGSEDIREDVACAPVWAASKKTPKMVNDVFSQQEMLPDMDFVRAFADGVSMSYEVNADGSRKRTQLLAHGRTERVLLGSPVAPVPNFNCPEAIAHDKQLSACAACSP